MPVVLPQKHYAGWLDAEADKEGLLEILSAPMDSGFEFWPVSTDVGSPKNDRADLLEPIQAA